MDWRRARVAISADGLTYRFLLRPEARFHDGTALTAARRRVFAHHAEGKGPSDHHAVRCATCRRGGGRRRHRGRALRGKARARRAAVCRGPADFFARLLRKQPVRRIDARHSARLRRLQSRAFRGRPLHRIRARQGLVGRKSAGVARTEQFRHPAVRILPRPRRRLRGIHRQRTICSARNSPRASGRRVTIFPPSATAASSATYCPTIRRPARKAGSSTRGGRNSRIRRCAKR